MSTQQPDHNLAYKEEARLILDRVREIAKGTSKTAFLWVAALAIVWLTGLEATNRKVTTRYLAIQQGYQRRQHLQLSVARNARFAILVALHESQWRKSEEFLQK